MSEHLPTLVFAAGIGQLCVLVASALVPLRLKWRTELSGLPRLHRQMYWVYGGYIVLSIVAFGVISVMNAPEIAGGSGLARGFAAYVAAFWCIRVFLQPVLDVREHLVNWWLKAGYHSLTLLFIFFTIVYAWAALWPATQQAAPV